MSKTDKKTTTPVTEPKVKKVLDPKDIAAALSAMSKAKETDFQELKLVSGSNLYQFEPGEEKVGVYLGTEKGSGNRTVHGLAIQDKDGPKELFFTASRKFTSQVTTLDEGTPIKVTFDGKEEGERGGDWRLSVFLKK
jgi:hypothetical protein